MKINARVENSKGKHEATVATDGRAQRIGIQSRSTGFGSAASGGELLCLALATCYCNDIYREAAKRGIMVKQVEVEVTADFGAPANPARTSIMKPGSRRTLTRKISRRSCITLTV
jgi:uncharacterized OsmC-like protein